MKRRHKIIEFGACSGNLSHFCEQRDFEVLTFRTHGGKQLARPMFALNISTEKGEHCAFSILNDYRPDVVWLGIFTYDSPQVVSKIIA